MPHSKRVLLSRRELLAATCGTACSLWLAGCSGESKARTKRPEQVVLANEQAMPPIDFVSFNSILQRGPVAPDEAFANSQWAQRIKAADMLRVGGILPSPFFCMLVDNEGAYRGLDAGLFQLLARYLTGDATHCSFEPLGVGDREVALVDDLVDAVFATYVATPERKELIDFSNPYFESYQSIMVLATTDDVSTVADLANKPVVVKSHSSSIPLMQKVCPTAQLEQITADEEARLALAQNRAVAYVGNDILQMSTVACNPNTYKIVGNPLGDPEEFCIGLPKDSGAVDFVNEFLTQIKASGLLEELAQVTIYNRVNPPEEEDETKVEDQNGD